MNICKNGLIFDRKREPLKGIHYFIYTGYEWGQGWTDNEKAAAYHKACDERLFPYLVEHGWTKVKGWDGTFVKGTTGFITFHPMEIVVYGTKDTLAFIKDFMTRLPALFERRDENHLKDEVEQLSVDEYRKVLEANREKLARLLWYTFTRKYAKKRDVCKSEALYDVFQAVRLENTGEWNLFGSSSTELTYRFLAKLMDDLDRTGQLDK
jgi:hypothetical protein